jgi:hypothetical protein
MYVFLLLFIIIDIEAEEGRCQICDVVYVETV